MDIKLIKWFILNFIITFIIFFISSKFTSNDAYILGIFGILTVLSMVFYSIIISQKIELLNRFITTLINFLTLLWIGNSTLIFNNFNILLYPILAIGLYYIIKYVLEKKQNT